MTGGIGWHPNASNELIDAYESNGPTSWLYAGGYIRYYWTDHPKANRGAILEHRAIGYLRWGDAIDGMHIDHINNEPGDNRPENLQLLSRKSHGKKTATLDGLSGFWVYAKEVHPEWIEEWKSTVNFDMAPA